MADPLRNVAYTTVAILSVDNPTIAAGDFQVSIDGGSFANLTTLPTAIDSSAAVLVSLSASEMDGDNIVVRAQDQAGSEWSDTYVHIQTGSQIDGYPIPNALAIIGAAAAGRDATPTADGAQYRALDDSKTRITATENRASITLDGD